ncbi:anaerobic nucleotide reductase subunit [Yersinia phage JC221]|nr:anaerobic nucleotide reductase subunit [Yersinia phage JC221]
MKYDRIYDMDVVNGKGFRVVLFVTGCNHKCVGCYNKSTWNPCNGVDFTQETEKYLFELLNNPLIDGLTLTGGDPFYRDNYHIILNLLKRFSERFPDKNVWLWTGYTLEQLQADPARSVLLPYIDVLIDGKYEQSLPTKKPFRGSDNQRLVEFRKNSIEITNIS